MTINKTKLALGIAAATFSMAMLAPQAQADTTDAAALQSQLQQMADQMKAMQSELDRVKATAETAANADSKVQELDQWMSSVKSSPEASSSKDNLVVVRGGWAQLDHARGLSTAANSFGGAGGVSGELLTNNGNAQGHYYGGAFDYNINNDLFGFADNTSFLIELGIEYSEFGAAANTLTGDGVLKDGAKVGGNAQQASDNRLRINASPKIKFLRGSKIRPWIIPVGLDINILGVPSNAVSVLGSGMQFGGGVDYDLWRGIVVGGDARYHYSTSTINGVPTDGFTLGGYVGFKF